MTLTTKPDSIIAAGFGTGNTPFCLIAFPKIEGLDRGRAILEAFDQVTEQFPRFLEFVVLRPGFRCFVVEKGPKNLPN